MKPQAPNSKRGMKFGSRTTWRLARRPRLKYGAGTVGRWGRQRSDAPCVHRQSENLGDWIEVTHKRHVQLDKLYPEPDGTTIYAAE